jgi:deoxycytidylate deaminase
MYDITDIEDKELDIVTRTILLSRKGECCDRKVCASVVIDKKLFWRVNHVRTGNGPCETVRYICPVCKCSDGTLYCETCKKYKSAVSMTLTTVEHAEDALLKAIKNDTKLYNDTLYVTDMPCSRCAKTILKFPNIKRVVYVREFTNSIGGEILRSNSIKLVKFDTTKLQKEIQELIS